MWKARYYVPLAAFVLPTLIIGYGFVIPCSCIRGVNQLSVGFGTTVLGAIFTYFAGIRAATSGSCSVRAPLHLRLLRKLNQQASHPRGVPGRALGFIWSFEHRALNRQTLALLELQPTDRVLDVGSGPGLGVRLAAAQARRGHVTGIDVSTAMIEAGTRRNLGAVRAERVDFRRVVDSELGLEPNSYEKIYSVHCIYFWRDPKRTLSQLLHALRPGGRLVITFRPDSADIPERFRDPTYRFYSAEELERMLMDAGFDEVHTVSPAPETPVRCIVAGRSRAS